MVGTLLAGIFILLITVIVLNVVFPLIAILFELIFGALAVVGVGFVYVAERNPFLRYMFIAALAFVGYLMLFG
jgi:hypothetical protein